MKATLTFNLDDADDRMAHLRCIKSSEMASALFKITQVHKHTKTVEQYHDKIIDAIGNLNLDELIS